MFTGIVETTALITDSRPTAGGRRLCVEVGNLAAECELGASICISGICLTVAAKSPAELEFDVIKETLARSTLGRKVRGDRVNVERSLCVGSRLDGHFVQGHVDAVARIVRVQKSSQEHLVWLGIPEETRPFLIPKGSVAMDGISLTIADLTGDAFAVALIPTTLERTTLADLKTGDCVNIESDMIARTVVHNIRLIGSQPGLSIQTLQEAGFL